MVGEIQPRTESIIDEREEENMIAGHVYSHPCLPEPLHLIPKGIR
jgi:hypothetical protein